VITKLIGITSFALAVFLYLLAINSPNDLIFYIVSGNLIFAICRLLLAAGLLVIIFGIPKLDNRIKTAFIFTGLAMIVFGILGLLTNVGVYAFYEYIKPLDFMTFMQIGAAISLVGIEKSNKVEISSASVAASKTKPAFITRLLSLPTSALRSNKGVKYVLR